jgi:hypothetical protein
MNGVKAALHTQATVQMAFYVAAFVVDVIVFYFA